MSEGKCKMKLLSPLQSLLSIHTQLKNHSSGEASSHFPGPDPGDRGTAPPVGWQGWRPGQSSLRGAPTPKAARLRVMYVLGWQRLLH